MPFAWAALQASVMAVWRSPWRRTFNPASWPKSRTTR